MINVKRLSGLEEKHYGNLKKNQQQKTYKNLNNSEQKLRKQKINKAGKIILANLVQQQKQNPYGIW